MGMVGSTRTTYDHLKPEACRVAELKGRLQTLMRVVEVVDEREVAVCFKSGPAETHGLFRRVLVPHAAALVICWRFCASPAPGSNVSTDLRH